MTGRQPPNARNRSGYLRLRTTPFDTMTRLLGLENDQARARFLGISARSLYRSRHNVGKVGEDALVQILVSLGDYSEQLGEYNCRPGFYELFEVVRTAEKVERAGWFVVFYNDSSAGRSRFGWWPQCGHYPSRPYDRSTSWRTHAARFVRARSSSVPQSLVASRGTRSARKRRHRKPPTPVS